MSENESQISEWLERYTNRQDEEAADQLWQAYYPRLRGLARKILERSAQTCVGDEDVAASAFKTFFHRAAEGRFPQLHDRDGLWKLLMTITIRKANRVLRRKRPVNTSLDIAGVGESVAAPSPTVWDTTLTQEFEELVSSLGDDRLRAIVMGKFIGLENRDLAAELGCSVSTIERKLQLVRKRWSGLLSEP